MKPFRIPSVAAAFALSVTLIACQQQAPADSDAATEQPAAPEAKPGTAVSGGELFLPPVAGRPGGVYFKVTNGSDAPVTLVSAYVEGAGNAEMHQTSGGKMESVTGVEIKPGETVDFARGGMHVMAFDLKPDLAAGGTTELTLSFSDGDKISAPLAIKTMGGEGDMADMPGMDHGADH